MTHIAEVAMTSLDRVLWPRTGFTKRDLIAYYDRAAPALIPHISGRALTLGRFPSGVEGRGFAQTECRGHPEWMATRAVRLRDGRVRRYCVVNDHRSLLWVANQSAVELHSFLSRGERHDEPTHVVFDLDPGPGTEILDCARVALRLRERLAEMGLASFVKTSGFLGIHVQVPLNTPHTYARTKAFARRLAAEMAAADPAAVTDQVSRAARADRVLVDWLGNDVSRSLVAAYSLRAGDFPTVSAPLSWEEVEAARSARELTFMPQESIDRVARNGDPLAPALRLRQHLPV
jgi:bifunctional non-homologous end joining protein LigD